MNYRRIRTQSLAGLLVVSFLIPTGLAIPAKRVEAQANCVAPIAGAISTIPVLAGVEKALGITTSQQSNAVGQALGAGSSFGTFFNNCILKPLAITMARTMVRSISNSIVNWINGGFQGKPGFVTDFKSLVADSADQAIGNYIYGTDLKFLCQPFSVKIRLQLATKYQKKFQEEIRCTLSSVTGNVNSFVNNNGGTGWNNWLELTTQPQNNQYGAYLIAESELASRIQTQLDQITKTLDRSGGFLDFKVCDDKVPKGEKETTEEARARADGAKASLEEYGTQYVSQKDTDPTPRCKTGGRVVTPGSLVGEQANKVLGGWADQLNLATEIDQIVGALISHFADKMITGAQGFLGLSSAGGYAKSNISVSQALAAGDDLTLPENAGLRQLSIEAESTVTFTENITAPQIVEAGVNILEGKSVRTTSPTGVASSNLVAITDGSINTIGSIGSIGSGVQSLWVKFDLGTSTQVSEIHVWHPDVIDPAESIGTFNMVFSSQESGRTWVSNEYTLTQGSPNPTVVRVDRVGRYITLERKPTCTDNCQPLRIAEIEVIGLASRNSSVESSTSTEPVAVTRVTFGPTDGEVVLATSSPMNFKIPIRTTKNTVIKSLDINLSSATTSRSFNSIMSGGISLTQGGFRRNNYPGSSSGVQFTNLSLTTTGETEILINGRVNSVMQLGSYKFDLVMKDETGEILDTRTVNFVVQ